MDPFLLRNKVKIVIYDQARVNGRSNYEYPGQCLVSKRSVFNEQSLFVCRRSLIMNPLTNLPQILIAELGKPSECFLAQVQLGLL